MPDSAALDVIALDPIERSVLPSLSLALDALIETASLARPGIDADAHAAAVRSLAGELDSLGRAFAALAVPAREDYPAAA